MSDLGARKGHGSQEEEGNMVLEHELSWNCVKVWQESHDENPHVCNILWTLSGNVNKK